MTLLDANNNDFWFNKRIENVLILLFLLVFVFNAFFQIENNNLIFY